jgi:radical SAM superfamily enzyme YgiQ (UPF0313 family)
LPLDTGRLAFGPYKYNVTAKEDYAFGLFDLFKHYGVKWMGFTTIKIALNEALLKKAQEGGCISLFIGFESLLQENLNSVSKRFVDAKELSKWVQTIQRYQIGIQGAFIFGFDEDDATIFRKTVEFVQKNNIELPTFSILTPFPGLLFKRDWKRKGEFLIATGPIMT